MRSFDRHFHADRGTAIADCFGNVSGVLVHGEGGADGCVVGTVFAVGPQHVRMRVGRGSNTAGLWRAMHLVSEVVNDPMLPSTFYRRNSRIP